MRGSPTLVLTGDDDSAHDLIGYDHRLRCACTLSQGRDRCMQKATAEDMRCDFCRDGEHKTEDIVYLTAPVESLNRETLDRAMKSLDGHVLLLGIQENASV